MAEARQDRIAPAWARFVDEVRTAVPPLARIDRLPDGSTGLLYRLLEPGRGTLWVLGPCTRAAYKSPPAFAVAVHVVFRPGGAYPFFGVPLDELTDRIVPAAELWGAAGDRLLAELVELGDSPCPGAMAARRAAIGAALAERLRPPTLYEPAASAAVRAAIRRLAVADEPIEAIAASIGISPRNLRRAFSAAVGISPKLYARIARFRRAAASAGAGRWADVARSAGYADHSHLVGDFRALAGVSPGALARDDVEHLRRRCPGGD